jgi:DNA-binding phage protein
MMKIEPAVSYKADLLERLRDTEYATGYLNAVLEEGDEAAFQFALRDVAEAQQMPLPATPLQWSEVTKLLRALGLQLRLDLARVA